MKFRQLSVLIFNVWLTQQTISGGGPHVRAHPCGHRTREDSFRLLYNVHFTSQAATQVSHIFHFLSFFWKKKKEKEIHVVFVFVFSPRADIIAEEFVNGCKCEFQSQSNVFDCFKYYKVKCIWRNIYGSTRRVNNMTVFRHCMHSNQ